MSGSGSRIVRLAVACYDRALTILPASFLSRHRRELRSCFGALAREARGRGRFAVAGVLLRSLLDLVLRAPREHRIARRGRAALRGASRAATFGSGLGLDLRHALRRVRRQPAFTATTVLTLGLAMAAAITVLSLVHGVVLRPLPYPDSERLVVVDHAAPGLDVDDGLGMARGLWAHYRDGARTLEEIAIYRFTEPTWTGDGEPVRLRGVSTTPSLGAVLGVTPQLGRWLPDEDGERTGTGAVVLAHGLWQRRFGGSRAVLGSVLHLDGRPHEVVGVMPADFAFPDREVEVWLPWTVDTATLGGFNSKGVARLRAGSSQSAAATELRGLLPSLRDAYPGRTVEAYLDEARIVPLVVPLLERMVGGIRRTLWALWGAAGFLLLVAVANVTNLFLARTEEGARAIALREALGASRGRLYRGLVAETVLLAGTAGALALALAVLALRALRAGSPVPIPRLETVGVDPVVVAWSVGGGGLVAAVLAALPLLAGRRGLPARLEGARGNISTHSGLGLRRILVVLQMAAALVLLVGSGLLLRTYHNLRAVEPGFDTRSALAFEIGLPRARYPHRADAVRFHARLHRELATLPGVEDAAAVGQCLPLTGPCWGDVLLAEGRPVPESTSPPVAFFRTVTPGYHRTLGTPILRGRGLRAGDGADGGLRVAVVSAETARRLFPGRNPVGGRISTSAEGPWVEVVGVAADVKEDTLADEPHLVVYLPLTEGESPGPPPHKLHHVLRTSVVPTSLVPAVRRVVHELDPLIPVADLQTLEELVAEETAPAAFVSLLIGLAAALTSLLGIVGLYAVVAWSVSRRRREIGVRMALGARPGDVRWLVLGHGGRLVASGLALGLLGAGLATRVLRGLLYGVDPVDPVTFGAVALVLSAVAAAALVLPARRAARVDPSRVLAEEG